MAVSGIAGLQAAVYAGLAVSIPPPFCALTSNLQRIGEAEGLPTLPELKIIFQRRTGGLSVAADHLASYIGNRLGDMPI